MEQKKFFQTFSSNLKNVKPVVNEILDFLTKELYDLSEEEYFELKLIYSELLANAVIHGNQNQIEKKVYVKTEIHPDWTIIAEISDEGEGFDLHRCHIPPSLLCEHGRGIGIVLGLADEITTNVKGNALFLRKQLKKKVKAHET